MEILAFSWRALFSKSSNDWRGIMKTKTLGFSLLLLIFSASQVVFSQVMAADENIKEMATIMLNLHHFPSAADKETLRDIAINSASSKYEKTMANAMIHLEHSATAEDKEKLSEIIKDNSAPEDVRTLATIIRDVNHMPSEEDKEKLQKLM